ncbi:MAG TPA: diguanylate cyclase [Steroidobacteraceae bacterium]|nr:diguanylate cyclase [Steroidobacteraceae bacterium]
MNNWSAETWRMLVDGAPEGVVVCDATTADHPVVYANAAFATLSGYAVDALLGKNLRILQGRDREQDGRQRMREALTRAEPARVLMRNYRQDGTLFWNEVVIQPLRNGSGRVTHFIGYYRDASERLKDGEKPSQGLPSWLREDRLTGLHSRAYFEELLQRDWLLAQRDSHEIALTLFDIDDLSTYNDTFDKSAGDACIRRVARVIAASYRRGGDLVGRWEGGTLAALTQGDAAQKAPQYAQVVAQRVRDLLIHHPRNGAGRYLTISAGVANLVPQRDMPLEALLNACRGALKRAKTRGKNSIITAEEADFA